MTRISIVMSVTLLLTMLSACGKSSAPEKTIAMPGEAIYNQNCKVCHAQGINGAPILGNQAMWADRAPQGEAILVQHAMEGYGLMPAKGGKAHLSDEEITHVVQYMLSKLE